MSRDAEVVRISEVRGADGSSAYLIEGGKPGEGAASYHLTREAMQTLETQGKDERDAALRRGIETTLQGRHESS